MLPDIQPGNTKILYFFNCLLDGMHTTITNRTNNRKNRKDISRSFIYPNIILIQNLPHL